MSASVQTCGQPGEHSLIPEKDCSSCSHHHESEDNGDTSPEDNSSGDDSQIPHDHHHGCQVVISFVLPDLQNALFSEFRSPSNFQFVNHRLPDGQPQELDRPPRG